MKYYYAIIKIFFAVLLLPLSYKNKNSFDKLKSDEITLYKTIKDRYPKMSDEEIKSEIQSVI